MYLMLGLALRSCGDYIPEPVCSERRDLQRPNTRQLSPREGRDCRVSEDIKSNDLRVVLDEFLNRDILCFGDEKERPRLLSQVALPG